jgi:hypothetical protein
MRAPFSIGVYKMILYCQLTGSSLQLPCFKSQRITVRGLHPCLSLGKVSLLETVRPSVWRELAIEDKLLACLSAPFALDLTDRIATTYNTDAPFKLTGYSPVELEALEQYLLEVHPTLLRVVEARLGSAKEIEELPRWSVASTTGKGIAAWQSLFSYIQVLEQHKEINARVALERAARERDIDMLIKMRRLSPENEGQVGFTLTLAREFLQDYTNFKGAKLETYVRLLALKTSFGIVQSLSFKVEELNELQEALDAIPSYSDSKNIAIRHIRHLRTLSSENWLALGANTEADTIVTQSFLQSLSSIIKVKQWT